MKELCTEDSYYLQLIFNLSTKYLIMVCGTIRFCGGLAGVSFSMTQCFF